MATDYSPAELKQIAQIGEDQHVGLLTACGIHQDNARKIIAMSDDVLAQGIAAVEGRPNKTPAQEAMIAAGRRELTIRQA